MEKGAEGNDGGVDQEPAQKRHDHGWNTNNGVMSQHNRQRNSTKHEESCKEATKINDSASEIQQLDTRLDLVCFVAGVVVAV